MDPSKAKHCVMLGAGGHAGALVECLRASGFDIVRAAVDPDEALWGADFLGVPIVGGDDALPRLVEEGADSFVVGVGSARDNGPRERLYELGLSLGLQPLTVTHPTAMISPSARLGDGAQALPRSVIHTRARLGVNVIVNCGAIVEHDCVVEDHVHVATGAQLAGGVTVERGALVGLGSSIRQGVRIGARAVVGAGAVAVKDVEPGAIVVGVPCRPVQTQGRPNEAEQE